MSTESYHKILNLEVHNASCSLHFIDMWQYVEEGDFDGAMTSQLLYLVNIHERDELIDSLDDEDYNVGVSMIDLMYGE